MPTIERHLSHIYLGVIYRIFNAIITDEGTCKTRGKGNMYHDNILSWRSVLQASSRWEDQIVKISYGLVFCHSVFFVQLPERNFWVWFLDR